MSEVMVKDQTITQKKTRVKNSECAIQTLTWCYSLARIKKYYGAGLTKKNGHKPWVGSLRLKSI